MRSLLILGAALVPATAFGQQQDVNVATDTQAQVGASTAAEGEAEGATDSSFDTGGQVGFSPVAGVNHYLVNLTIDAHLAPFQSAIRAPLRFETASGNIRGEDYDEAGDFLRIGQCVRLDFEAPSVGGSGIGGEAVFEKERGQCLPWQIRSDDYYLSVRLSKIDDYSIGHGTQMQSFSNSTDVNHYNAGVVGDLQLHEFFTGQLQVDRLVGRDDRFGPQVLGGRLGLRPYTRYADEGTWAETVDQFELAITTSHDLHAPSDLTAIDTDGDSIGDSFPADDQGNILEVDPTTGSRIIDFSTLSIIGLDAVYRFKWAGALQVEARADFNKIVGFGQGGHGQFWFIFHERRFDVRAEAEYRFVSPQYIPAYFDSTYGITSQQFNLGADPANAITKLEFLEGLDAGEPWKHGLRGGFNFDYQIGEGADRRSVFVLQANLDTVVDRGAATNLDVSLGIPRLANKIDVTGQFSSRNARNLGDLFGNIDKVARLFVRWDLSSQFYLNLSFNKVFVLDTRGLEEGFQSSVDAIASIGFQETVASAEGTAATTPAPATDDAATQTQ